MTGIILINLDDLLDFDHWEDRYGVDPMTNLNAIATGGTRFDAAYCQVGVCNGSRASYGTGLEPQHTQVFGNAYPLFPRFPFSDTLPGVFDANGFRTGVCGKCFHPGDDDALEAALGADYQRFLPDTGGDEYGIGVVAESALEDRRIADFALSFLAGVGSDDFFLWAGLYAPHSPLLATQADFDAFPSGSFDIPDIPAGSHAPLPAFAVDMLTGGEGYHDRILKDGVWEDLVQAYLARARLADRMIGEIVAAADATGRSDIVIVTLSDHGYHEGDKERWRKFTLWEEALKVPFIFKGAGVDAGSVVERPVALTDLAPTLYDIAGIDASALALDGRTLKPALEGFAIGDVPVVSWMFGSWSARLGDLRYTRYEDGTEELHDLAVDPGQNDNVVAAPGYAADITALRAAVAARVLVHEGTSAREQFMGGDGADVFAGYLGADTLIGRGGGDTYILSDWRPDIIEEEGGGHDVVYLRVPTDYTLPRHVEDLAIRQDGGVQPGVRLVGNDGDNFISGSGGADEIYGGAGNDTLRAWDGEGNRLYGGPGDDRLEFGNLGETRGFAHGGAGNDTIVGSTGGDYIVGGTGDDTLQPGSGDDFAAGGPGDDLITGGAGDDVLHGGEGDDNLTANAGDDLLTGGPGADVFKSGGGANTYRLGAGDGDQDRIILNAASTGVSTAHEWGVEDRIVVTAADFTSIATQQDVLDAITDVGPDAVLSLTSSGAHEDAAVTLAGVAKAELTTANVVLS